ncbi:chitobiase/beta-hexosaminidase C-terminal domain-containing protein [Paenibacillus sp. 1P07SE]|uniref:chitobiase/beta-hexosaminidase C-terminal domain-containing protein n=1 Tax=Paenibacillus sp. 1P07SE TaxID=3132209 RepID=UPI0039A4635A
MGKNKVEILRKWGLGILMTALLLQMPLYAPESVQAAETAEAVTVDIDLQDIVNDDFLGVGVNLIPVSFMEGTSRFGYNETHWEMDRKRILAMKPRVARVWFQTDWMEVEKGVYTWNSDKMVEFYRYMDVLQEAGTEVEFNFGWKVGTQAQEWFSFPDVDKRISAPVDLDAFANAASAALNQLIHVKGYDHIKYLTFYNEANGNWDFEAPGDQRAYFAEMVKKVSDKLTVDGLRDDIEIWGPEESGAPAWTQYMQENADAYFDAYTFHVYGQSYEGLTKSITDRTSVAGGKPVMMTEFGFAEDNSSWSAGLTGSVIKAANMGLGGALIWQLNGVWLPDPYVGNDTNGNYTMWDSLVLGTDPYRRYYESSLLTRYIPPHSSVAAVNTGTEDVRAAAFKTADGDVTVVLETKAGTNKEVTIDFNEVVNKPFNKHVYKADVVVDGNALIPAVSGTFPAGQTFTDTAISADHNIIVYTTMAAQTQVEVTPIESTVAGGATLQLDANVIDNTGGVTWSVVGAGNGSITNGGLYMAPQVTEEKLVAIRATSDQDAEGYGIAFVKVRPAAPAGQVAIPEFSLPYGKYPSGEAIVITTATPDAEIRYTLDGSTPTETSELYTSPIFPEPGTTRLKAVAFKAGMTPSPETFSLYKLANASFGPEGYTFCAYEDGFDCEFEGEASVAFGADGLFNYATLTDGAACTAAVFGDPLPGTDKRCYYTYNIPAELPVVTVYNAGFETPNIDNYRTGPMTNGWYFNVRSGVQRNGSQFAIAAAPQGSQTAFMVGRDFIGGEISQRINFKEGDYELWFSMASRTSPGTELPFEVYIDDTLIGSFEPDSPEFTLHKTDAFTASAGYHTIKFAGAATETDHAVFFDAIKIRTAGMAPPPPDEQDPPPPELPLETLSNAGFEEPVVTTHRAGPMKHSWTFNPWSGVQRNGGAFGAADAPEGMQTGYLQTTGGNFGEITQYLNFEEGTYKLEFEAAKRATNGGRTQSFEVYFDDLLIGSYALTSASFEKFLTFTFDASEGAHTIRFVATLTPGQTGESTGFIDAITLVDWADQPPVPPVLVNSGFEAPSIPSYKLGPMTNGWVFDSLTGVQRNGGAMGANEAPEGVQTALLQTKGDTYGEISQSVIFEAGTYEMEFFAAKRTASGGRAQSFDVYFDDTVIGSYTVTDAAFEPFTTDSFTASAGLHTLKFVGKQTEGLSTSGNSMAFIDQVNVLVSADEPEEPEEPAGEPVAKLTGSSLVKAGEAMELTIELEDVGEGYTALDVIVHYDPSRLELETLIDDEGHPELAPQTIQSLTSQMEVAGTAVKPDLGQIRIIMLSRDTPVSGNHQVLTLHGEAKAAAASGPTEITLSDFAISNASSVRQINTDDVTLTVQVSDVDTAALNTEIANAQAIHDGATEGSQHGQYPNGSKATLKAAILAAIAVRDHQAATQQEVNAAYTALQQAVSSFKNSIIIVLPSADKTALIAAITQAQAKHDAAVDNGKLGHYAQGSKAALQTAIDSAKAVREQAAATQAQVDQATADVNAALQQFGTQLVTLVEGKSKISIADLSILANYYGVGAEDPGWSEVAIADLFDEEEITIRVLAAVARMILDDWLSE